MRFVDLFDGIFIVNLPHRLDRRNEMEEQLQRVGWQDHPAVQFFPAIRPQDAGEFPNIGARGCFSSHLAILADAAHKGRRRILILEDDLDFSHDFLLRTAAMTDRLQQDDWGIFYGGYEWPDELKQGLAGEGGVVRPVDPQAGLRTTHFIAFQAPAIARVADYLQAMLARPGGHPDGGPMHVDGAYSWFRRQNPDVLTLVAVPELGYQRSSRTDIHPPGWIDRLPLLSSLVAGLRRLKNRMRGAGR